MYEEVEIKVYAETAAFGAPFCLVTSQGKKRDLNNLDFNRIVEFI